MKDVYIFYAQEHTVCSMYSTTCNVGDPSNGHYRQQNILMSSSTCTKYELKNILLTSI